MPTPHRRNSSLPRREAPRCAAAAALAGLLCFVGLAACSDDPIAPGARDVRTSTPIPATAPVEGTSIPVPPPPPAFPNETAEQADARIRAWRVDLDKKAHAVLDRFRAAVYDPSRDGGLKSAEGTIDVTVDGKSAQYAFTFDGTTSAEPVPTMRTVREDVGTHSGAARQAKRFAIFATRGPSAFVLSDLPPLEFFMTGTKDGRTLVVTPPFKGGMGVSYRINKTTDLVEMSGATNGQERVRTVFHWAPSGKLWRLTRAVIEGGAVAVDYEFETRDGIELLRRAAIQEGLHTYEATVSWTTVAKR